MHQDLIPVLQAKDSLGVTRCFLYQLQKKNPKLLYKIGGRTFVSVTEFNSMAKPFEVNKP